MNGGSGWGDDWHHSHLGTTSTWCVSPNGTTTTPSASAIRAGAEREAPFAAGEFADAGVRKGTGVLPPDLERGDFARAITA
jgi:hypothetical protein